MDIYKGEIALSVPGTLTFFMNDTADHVSGLPGVTVTVTASKIGSAFTAIGGAVTELTDGGYKLQYKTTDVNALGDLVFLCTGAGCDPTRLNCLVVEPAKFDPIGYTRGLLNELGINFLNEEMRRIRIKLGV